MLKSSGNSSKDSNSKPSVAPEKSPCIVGIPSTLFLVTVLVAIVAISSYWVLVLVNTASDPQPFNYDMSYRPASVFVLGATGEVGKEVVKELARHAEIQKVTLIGRRKVDLPSTDPSYQKFRQEIVDFDKLSDHADVFKGHDVGICSLGTTRGKSGADGFYKVDHDYVVNSAKLAKDGGTKHFSLISSGGANKNSYFLYPKVKGEVEEEVTNMGFERLTIYRPAVLLCDRTESRLGEAILRGCLSGLDRWRMLSIETSKVAAAVVRNIFNTDAKKVEILDNSAIRDLAQ